MTNDTPEFEWYDAWILAAVIHASDGTGPVPLWRVVGVADGLNKAIVTRHELELAFGRLVSAGYILVVPEGFEPTPSALALKAPGWPVGNVAKAIGAKEWEQGHEMPAARSETYVSLDAYNRAVKKYRKEFWKEIRSE